MPEREQFLAEAFRKQAASCASLGSAQYATLMRAIADDLSTHGASRDLLRTVSGDPWRDAVPLRFVAAVHRIVLRGDAPHLGDRYGSTGGDGGPIDAAVFLDVALAHRDEVEEALRENVQTNEVGRCAALRPAFGHVARRHRLPLNMLEIGASAGLLSHWDRYAYVDRPHRRSAGDLTSTVRLVDRWSGDIDLAVEAEVAARGMCDIAPLSALDRGHRERLMSFVWPDQVERLDLLSFALETAAMHQDAVVAADAGEWLAHLLPDRPHGTLTIVFHAIVWQYLPSATKQTIRSVLESEGSRSTDDNPIAWIRMEPAGPVADVRATVWPGGIETVLLSTSYHGADVRPVPAEAGRDTNALSDT